jgi:predicted amidophosphoribosyltransferase
VGNKTKCPVLNKYTYGSDLDGNRGIEVTEFLCPYCEGQLDAGDESCQTCGQPIEVEDRL